MKVAFKFRVMAIPDVGDYFSGGLKFDGTCGLAGSKREAEKLLKELEEEIGEVFVNKLSEKRTFKLYKEEAPCPSTSSSAQPADEK